MWFVQKYLKIVWIFSVSEDLYNALYLYDRVRLFLTQKLLQRTQARKEQLAKKREELAAYRAAKNPTNHDNRERRPLSEENKDHKENAAETIKKPKIDSDAKDVQRDRVKNAPEIDANSPSIKVPGDHIWSTL